MLPSQPRLRRPPPRRAAARAWSSAALRSPRISAATAMYCSVIGSWGRSAWARSACRAHPAASFSCAASAAIPSAWRTASVASYEAISAVARASSPAANSRSSRSMKSSMSTGSIYQPGPPPAVLRRRGSPAGDPVAKVARLLDDLAAGVLGGLDRRLAHVLGLVDRLLDRVEDRLHLLAPLE